MKIIILILIFPTILYAGQIKSTVTYPTADTATINGKTYHLQHSAEIYQKIVGTDAVVAISDKKDKENK
jgi:hypothetical protein